MPGQMEDLRNSDNRDFSMNTNSIHSKKEIIKLLLVVACYFCAGAIALTSHTVLSSFERDGTEMLFDAERIFNGQGYNSDFWPFGFMASIAFVKWASGMDYFTSAKLITLLSGTGILMLTYFTARYVFSEGIALLAVLILATNHFFFFHSFLVEMDMLYTFLFLLSIYFLVRGNEWRNFLLSGAVAGISYMVKYGAYAFFPVVVLVALISAADRGIVDSLKKITVFIAAFFVFSSPWLVHNAVKNGSPFYSKHYVNVAWGINRPRPLTFEYWGEYFRLNEEYSSMKDVIADTEKFIRNWLENIRGLPLNFYNILFVMGYFMPAGILISFKALDRRRLILILMTLSYLSLVTIAYTWDRYLIPLMSIFCMFIAYCIYEIIPEIFSLKKVNKLLSFNVPFRICIVAILILISVIKSYSVATEFLEPGNEELHEYKIAGEWLKGKLKKDDWLMVPQPQAAWYAGTDRMVKYPADETLPLEEAVKMREQNSFFFWHETLDNPIITDVDYVIYDKHVWKSFLPSLISDNGLPVVPHNFIEVFSTQGKKTHVIIYKINHE